MKKIILALLLTSLVLIPSFAFAESFLNIREQIEKLLAQVKILQERLLNLDNSQNIATTSIKVILPNGGESYYGNQPILAEWSFDYSPTDPVLHIFHDSLGSLYSKSIAGEFGKNSETILQSYQRGTFPSGKYTISICDEGRTDSGTFGKSAKNICDSSDASFSIVSNDTKVISPNGGESLKVGDYVDVKWSTKGLSTAKKINIWLYDTSSDTGELIIAGTANDGLETWKIREFGQTLYDQEGKQVSPSGTYKIFSECADKDCTTDYSDDSFKITSNSASGIRYVAAAVFGNIRDSLIQILRGFRDR